MQDHPGLRGTPLAMMAALCNKTASMSPPPLADAAVGKGFHPWKKSGGSNSPEATGSGGRGSQPVTTSPPGAAAAFSPPPHQATSPSPSYGKIRSGVGEWESEANVTVGFFSPVNNHQLTTLVISLKTENFQNVKDKILV